MADTQTSTTTTTDQGWHKVTYPKRNPRRPPPSSSTDPAPNCLPSHVFASLELKSHDRRLALAAASAAADEDAPVPRSRAPALDSDNSDDDTGPDAPPGAAEPKKIKQKKTKKPKITIAEAASKIDEADLAIFLADISVSFETQQDIQLMRFADYFGRAFAQVVVSQFPWAKMFKESSVAKIADIPMCHISEPVYKTSVDWIAQKSPEALGDFILWCIDGILADLASQQVAAKGVKKPIQQTPKAQVAIFVVLAMALRRKPDILISLLPKLKDPKYQTQEKLPFIVWIIAQASQGDLVVGMYSWVHYVLPSVFGKSSINPQSRDLALQLVERILSGPKGRPILLNGAVRKGERLVSPSALDLLMRVTFPAPSARVKATERLEAVFPTLKELALAGSPGTKTTKQASQQLLPFASKAIQEKNPDLTREATDVFIWCLSQNPECYRQWEKLHLENLDASVAVLRKLSGQWKEYSVKLSPLDSLRETAKQLRAKNEEALSEGPDAGNHGPIKEADKLCKVILGRLSRRSTCMKSLLLVLGLAIVAGYFASSPDAESFGWEKLHAMFSSLSSV